MIEPTLAITRLPDIGYQVVEVDWLFLLSFIILTTCKVIHDFTSRTQSKPLTMGVGFSKCVLL